MGTKGRILVALILTILLPGLIQGAAQAADPKPEIAGIPFAGAPGVAETIGQIMTRQAAREVAGPVEKDMEEEIEQPDRTHLPQNPASPDAATMPKLPPGFEQQSTGIEPFSPQTVGTNFTGATLSGVNPTLSFPPDCMGAVGPTQYVVFVNGRLVTFNKTTGVADGALNADPDVFFSSVVNGSYTSDPRIRYDRLTGRWFLVIINVSTPNRILLAVSDAASAGVISGSTVFTFFYIDIATTPPAISSTCLADYPTLGLDANALYIGTNNFCGSPSQTYNTSDGYVIRKTSIMGAGPIVVTVFRGLVNTSTYVGPYTPQGVDNLDPAATEGYFIGVDGASYGLLQTRRVSNPGGTPTISANLSTTVSTTTAPINVPHLGNTGGTSGRLSALDDRLFAAYIRNGRLWTAHNIQVNASGVASSTGGRNGSRWYELNVPAGSGAPTVVQSGTIFDAAASNPTSYWIPSVMVSGQGHAAVALSNAGNNARANAATVGRLSGDAAGTMQTPVLATASATAYNPPSDPGGSSGRRWGDYSFVSLDPIDDMSLWQVQMFCDAANSYGVRVTKLVAPPPATPASVPDVTAGQSLVVVTLTGTSASGSGWYDPGTNLPGVPAFNHLAVSILNGGATGTPPTVISATYVNPTTITLNLNASSATPNLAGEKYTVRVTNPDGQLASAAVLRVIAGTPTATIGAGPSLAEGNAGTTSFSFPVNLSSAATAAVTINYQTSDGTATTADGDYAATTSSIIIPIGGTGGAINIPVNGDTKFESNETFNVTLTGATNANLGAPVTATATILNDDTAPAASIASPAAQSEGNAGTTAFTFPVTLTNASASPVTVNYQTTDGSATVADNDYQASTNSIVIPANTLSGNIVVNGIGDTKYENDEMFGVSITGVTGGTIGASPTASGQLLNDDQPPFLSIDSVSQLEGNAGTTAWGFTVSLSEASGLPVSADFQTVEGTATLLNNDFQSSIGSVNFAPGVLTQPVTVLVNGDVTLESDETFTVNLSNLTGAQAGTLTGTGTIQNDDNVPSLLVADDARAEGNAGTTTFHFPVTLSNPTDQAVSVDWQTVDGSATSAGGDFAAASGTINIPAKSVTAEITVDVNGELCGEADETFQVSLSNPVNAVIPGPPATGTIQNDDDAVAPTVAVVAPNGGEILIVGSSTNITWNAGDNVGVTDVDILLSRDSGATYTETLASAIANSGSFNWTVTAPSSVTADCFVKVVAHDAGCQSGEDVSDAAFQVADNTSGVDLTGPVSEFALGLVRPNPTSGVTRVDYQLPHESPVRLSIVDLQGREVALLVNGTQGPGRYQATWDGNTARGPAARSVYFVLYQGGGKSFTQRLVLAR